MVAAFVCEYWCIVSYDIRVYNYLIIFNTSSQSKQRHICNGRKTYTCKNEYACDILPV